MLLETQMEVRDHEFCSFRDVTAQVMTWNAGACKPSYLNNDSRDAAFLRNLLTTGDPPDILVFGFQELVALEDKKVTASECNHIPNYSVAADMRSEFLQE
jgi:hypothetical protein